MIEMTDEIHDEPGHELLVSIYVEPTDDDGNDVDTPFHWVGLVLTGGARHPARHTLRTRDMTSDLEEELYSVDEPEGPARFIITTVVRVLGSHGLHDERQLYGPLVADLVAAVPGTVMTLMHRGGGWYHSGDEAERWPTPCDVHTPSEVKDALIDLAEGYLSSPVCESSLYGHMLALIERGSVG